MRVARELLRGLGDTGLSLPSWLSLSPANLLYREDFPQSTHGVGVTFVQIGEVSCCLTARRCRIWKLSRTYPGEKPSSLSVLTHRYSLATHNPTRHLLAMPWVLMRIRAPYESRWSTPFHLPRNYGTIFNPRFLKYNIKKTIPLSINLSKIRPTAVVQRDKTKSITVYLQNTSA